MHVLPVCSSACMHSAHACMHSCVGMHTFMHELHSTWHCTAVTALGWAQVPARCRGSATHRPERRPIFNAVRPLILPSVSDLRRAVYSFLHSQPCPIRAVYCQWTVCCVSLWLCEPCSAKAMYSRASGLARIPHLKQPWARYAVIDLHIPRRSHLYMLLSFLESDDICWYHGASDI